MAILTLLLTVAITLLGLTTAESCAANTTCSVDYPTGLLLLKSACPGPNVTIQQFNPGECINSTSFLSNDTSIASAITHFKATFVNGADFYVPEVTLYPAASCNASASTAKTWTIKLTNRDKYFRKTSACHRFKLGKAVPGSVRFTVRAVARRKAN